MRPVCAVGLLLSVMVFGLGCGGVDETASSALEVFVSIQPQAGLVEAVGGDCVRAHVLIKPGQDPHTFNPTPRQMMALGRAKLYFKIGLPFEHRILSKTQHGEWQFAVIDTAEGIKRRTMNGHHDHDEIDSKNHDHEVGLDPHIWLSPPLIKVQARNVADALAHADPGHAKEYRNNLERFLSRLNRTHERIQDMLRPYKGDSFYVFHPAFGYFGDAYGLHQEAVEVEGKRPSPRQLMNLIREAKAKDVRVIFVQPQFDQRSAQVVAQNIDGVVIPMDPLARDVLQTLEDMAGKMERALKKA
jgi:zinc transport system substrate-binding protein